MGTCRESRPLERAFDRLMNQMRTLDKLIWNYCSENIENSKYPLTKFENLKEDIQDFHFLISEFMDVVKLEEDKVQKLNEKLSQNLKELTDEDLMD